MKIDNLDDQPDELDDKVYQAEMDKIVMRTVSRSEHITRYVGDDLEALVDVTHIDLADELQIPLEYYQQPQDIIPLLCDDLAHMLMDGLITGFHLLLRDRELDPNTGAYPARYHAHYIIDSQDAKFQEGGGLISFPKDALLNARFTLLVDWDKNTRPQNKLPVRPEFNFDWVPESARFDTKIIRSYSQSGLIVDGIKVQRIEKR